MILEGKMLGNRYEIIEKVGNGGMAISNETVSVSIKRKRN